MESLNSVASGLNTENVNIGKLTKISNSATGEGVMGEVFYPSISKNGEFIVFESEATNLDANVYPLEADKYSSLIIIWVLDYGNN